MKLEENKMNKQFTISVTGHRPDKLWGYSLSDPHYDTLQHVFERELESRGCTDAWTGMALGADTVFARAVLALWNGTPGGTGNCVRYARSRRVPVTVIDPSEVR